MVDFRTLLARLNQEDKNRERCHKCDEPFEISPVAVDITGCNQAAEGGQRD